MRRRLPRYPDLAPLLCFKPLVLDPTRRRLERALTIDDLRRIARRRTPRAAFDYTDGAAEQEISLQRARQAFADIEFRPAILRDVSKVDATRTVLGREPALAATGVDASILSNHGGRQLDRAPVPIHLLPDVVREVGADVEVWLDTGIMSGADVVAGLAHGARFTLVGRAYLYGLMSGGRRGGERAIAILRQEIERTMKLLGVAHLDELERRHVKQLPASGPPR